MTDDARRFADALVKVRRSGRYPLIIGHTEEDPDHE